MSPTFGDSYDEVWISLHVFNGREFELRNRVVFGDKSEGRCLDIWDEDVLRHRAVQRMSAVVPKRLGPDIIKDEQVTGLLSLRGYLAFMWFELLLYFVLSVQKWLP